MKKRSIDELSHNFPFDPDKSPYSRFEEKIFPKILIIGMVIIFIIIYAFILMHFGWRMLSILIIPIFFFVLFIGAIIVRFMIWRREKKLGFE